MLRGGIFSSGISVEHIEVAIFVHDTRLTCSVFVLEIHPFGSLLNKINKKSGDARKKEDGR